MWSNDGDCFCNARVWNFIRRSCNYVVSISFDNLQNLDYAWRIILRVGVGTIPGTIALYFRLTIPETPRFTIHVQGNVEKATNNIRLALKHGKYVKEDEKDSEYRISTVQQTT